MMKKSTSNRDHAIFPLHSCIPAFLHSCIPAFLHSCIPAFQIHAEPITKAWFSNLRYLYYCLLLLAGLLLAAPPVQAEVKAGDILVTNIFGGTDGRGALVVVDAATGQRTILSDFGNAAQGSLGSSAGSVAVFHCRSDSTPEAANSESEAGNRNPHRCTDGETIQIFVSDFFARNLLKVDPDTGHRTVISDFSQGDIQGFPFSGLAVNTKGQVIMNLGVCRT